MADPTTPATIGWRIPAWFAPVAIAVLALAAWPVFPALRFMFWYWTGQPEYSHGILIPIVTAALVWQRREELRQFEFTGTAWGPAVVLFGFLIAALAELATVFTLIQYAFVIVVIGLVLSYTGARAFRPILVPMLMLLLMVPFPPFVVRMMSGELQLISSSLGVSLMRLVGVSVYLEGNVIDLGGYRLQVVEACDGLRYLFPLMTLGFVMAYVFRAPIWQKAVVFLSSVPLAIVMNGVRVGVIGITVDRWGSSMAEGLLHDVQGWVVFMLTAAIMLGEVVLLTRLTAPGQHWRDVFGFEWSRGSPPSGASVRRVPASFYVSAAIVAVAAFAWNALPERTDEVPVRRSFAEFPAKLGEFNGRRERLEAEYLDVLHLDDYVLGEYAEGAGPAVDLYIAYYLSQRKGQAVHSPRTCIPGGGWSMTDFRTISVAEVVQNGRALRVNRAVISRGEEKQLVYYWFKQRHRIVTNEWLVKWYLFWDALTIRRTDGALVRLVSPIPPGSDVNDADARLRRFAGELVPALPDYLPD